MVLTAKEGDTQLSLKALTPVRLLKNNFYHQVIDAEKKCTPVEELHNLLGKGRAKRGMFEGNLDEGELEIGQVSAIIDKIIPAAEIVKEICTSYEEALQQPVK